MKIFESAPGAVIVLLVLSAPAAAAGEAPPPEPPVPAPAGFAAAVPPPLPEGAEPVRVYTNEDLEKYAIYGRDPAPAPGTDEGWEFVFDVLDMQYGRLDADRRHDLDRSRVDRLAGSEAVAARRRLPWIGVHPFFPIFGRPGRPRAMPEPVLPHGRGLGIHGPGHGRFSGLRGEDAVPGPKPHRPHNGADVGIDPSGGAQRAERGAGASRHHRRGGHPHKKKPGRGGPGR